LYRGRNGRSLLVGRRVLKKAKSPEFAKAWASLSAFREVGLQIGHAELEV
jgi:hypothetical protein